MHQRVGGAEIVKELEDLSSKHAPLLLHRIARICGDPGGD